MHSWTTGCVVSPGLAAIRLRRHPVSGPVCRSQSQVCSDASEYQGDLAVDRDLFPDPSGVFEVI